MDETWHFPVTEIRVMTKRFSTFIVNIEYNIFTLNIQRHFPHRVNMILNLSSGAKPHANISLRHNNTFSLGNIIFHPSYERKPDANISLRQ